MKQWSQNPFNKGSGTTTEDLLIHGLEPVEDVVILWVPVERGTKNKTCSSASSDIADQRQHGGQKVDANNYPTHELKPKG